MPQITPIYLLPYFDILTVTHRIDYSTKLVDRHVLFKKKIVAYKKNNNGTYI